MAEGKGPEKLEATPLASKPEVGELVDGLVDGMKIVDDGFGELFADFRDLAERIEPANGNVLAQMTESAAGYLAGIRELLRVIKEGGKES